MRKNVSDALLVLGFLILIVTALIAIFGEMSLEAIILFGFMIVALLILSILVRKLRGVEGKL